MALVRPRSPVRHRTAFEFERSVREAPPARPDLLLWALAVMIWTYVWRAQDLFPVLAAVEINLLATGGAIALYALDRHPARRLVRLRTPVLWCALGLLAVAVIGIPASLYARRSAMSVLMDFIPNILLMVLLAASVRGMRDLEWMALVTVLGACAFCLFANLNFEVGPGGRLGNLVYYDANDLALVLVCTMPLLLFFLVGASRRRWLIAAASFVVFVVTIVRTGSRGGFLGFLAVLAYVLLAYTAVPKRIRLGVAAGAIALLSVVAGDAYWEQMRTLRKPQQDYNWSDQSATGRMQVWKRGLGYMAERPLFGVGLRNFGMAEGMLSEESKARAERGGGFKWSAAHNSFLEVGVELGVMGLALFVALFIAALRAMRRIKRARNVTDRATIGEAALASSLIASLIGFIVSGFFLSAWSFSYLYVILGLVVALTKLNGFAHPSLVPSSGWRTRLGAEELVTRHSRRGERWSNRIDRWDVRGERG